GSGHSSDLAYRSSRAAFRPYPAQSMPARHVPPGPRPVRTSQPIRNARTPIPVDPAPQTNEPPSRANWRTAWDSGLSTAAVKRFGTAGDKPGHPELSPGIDCDSELLTIGRSYSVVARPTS